MAEKRGNKELQELYLNCYESPSGQKVLEDLEQRFSDRPSFVPGDSHGTARCEGMREVILFIKLMMKKAREPETEAMDEELDDITGV